MLFLLFIDIHNAQAYLPENQKEFAQPKGFPQELIDEYSKRTVSIDISTENGVYRGSGVILSSNLVLTARHCVVEALEDEWKYGDNYIMVVKDTIKREVKVIVVCDSLFGQVPIFQNLDMAIVKIKDPGFPASYYTPGLNVVDSVGTGIDLFWNSYRVTTTDNGVHFGRLDRKELRPGFGCFCYIIDGKIVRGESGSGVYTLDGKLAGLLVGFSPVYNIFGFITKVQGIVVPIKYLRLIAANSNIIDLKNLNKELGG